MVSFTFIRYIQLESSFSKSMASLTVAPVWPKDRHFTMLEAFHFAACVRRIFKLATSASLNVDSKVADNNTSSKNEAISEGYAYI